MIKRQATEMDPATSVQQEAAVAIPRSTPTTYRLATVLVTPTMQVPPTTQRASEETTAVQELQHKALEHSNTLTELRQCCMSLATTQQQLASNMEIMNSNMNQKFIELTDANKSFSQRFKEMSDTLEKLGKASPTRPLKVQKETHSLPDINIH
jgi:predicted nuclease with TOPRIM domain